MAITQTEIPRRTHAGHKLIEGTLSTPLLQFDLGEEVAQQRQEDSWLRGIGRSSRTLVKHRDLCIVLTSLRAGTLIHEHKATARISIQTLSGQLRLRLPQHTVDLPAGQLLVLDQCLPHDVEAVKDSAFLLTLSWPPEEEIAECRARGRKKALHEDE